MSSAALLKLNVDTWLILDGDWPSQVHLLSKFVPFPVEVVMISPSSTASAKMVVRELARHGVKPCANGWFQCEFNAALSVFGGVVSSDHGIVPVMPGRLHAELPVDTPRSSEREQIHRDMTVDIPQNIEMSPPIHDLPEIEPTVVGIEEPVDGACDEQVVDQELWDFVTQGVGRDMDKATDIRSAITAKLGKQRAAELLSKTRVAVVRDCKGRNTRILRAGGVTLKLK
jgi:hypothetical protein